MANYTPITRTDLETIIDVYDIDDIIDFNSIDGGNANSSYRITTRNNQYVLSVLEEKSMHEAHDLAHLLQWLSQHQFFTSSIYETNTGRILSEYCGKPIILKQWISGKVIEDLKPYMLEEIGSNLAKLHEIPVPEFLPNGHAYGVQTFLSVTDAGLDLAYESWLKGQSTKIEESIQHDFPTGLIHGDLFYDNVLFEGDKLKAIIDFEEVCHYYLIFDIGMSILGLCRDGAEFNLTKAKALIKGYENIRKLEPVEKDYLKFFIEYAATATSRWRYWKYNIDNASPQLNNKHCEMMLAAEQIKKVTDDEFAAKVLN